MVFLLISTAYSPQHVCTLQRSHIASSSSADYGGHAHPIRIQNGCVQQMKIAVLQ